MMSKAQRLDLAKRLAKVAEEAKQRGDHPIANILRHAARDVEDWI